jgi:hypothetical protein
MSWAFAVFAMFSMLVLSIFAFLLIIYFKEFANEKKILEGLAKMPLLDLGTIPMYSAPKGKSATIQDAAPAKNKKDVN